MLRATDAKGLDLFAPEVETPCRRRLGLGQRGFGEISEIARSAAPHALR